jgi:DNA-binding MarR family transcriptional regulator
VQTDGGAHAAAGVAFAALGDQQQGAGAAYLVVEGVSAAVARLREAGAIVTEPDARDRRRLLVQPVPETSARVKEVRSTTIDAVLAKAMDTTDPHRVAGVVSLLEELARHLTPQALTRLHR